MHEQICKKATLPLCHLFKFISALLPPPGEFKRMGRVGYCFHKRWFCRWKVDIKWNPQHTQTVNNGLHRLHRNNRTALPAGSCCIRADQGSYYNHFLWGGRLGARLWFITVSQELIFTLVRLLGTLFIWKWFAAATQTPLDVKNHLIFRSFRTKSL